MFLLRALHPLWDALFSPTLSLSTRFRLLLLQPITLITYSIQWFVSRQFPYSRELWIPLKRAPGHSVRAVIFSPPAPPRLLPASSQQPRTRPPLHLNIHGGAFLGGLPEGDARFCSALAHRTGAVVVSTTYRHTPRYAFPAAHQDAQDVADYLVANAEELLGADPRLLTVSGFSAGGNLALAVAQGLAGTEYVVKGCTTFYTPVDFRPSPWEKPRPADFPTKDPLFFLQPLFDAYAAPRRKEEIRNPLLHPILAELRTLPQNMLFVIPTVDILLHEQTVLVERLKREARETNISRDLSPQSEVPDGESIVVRSEMFEGQLHGWLEMPSAAIDIATRTKALDEAITFLQQVYRAYGFTN